MARPQPVIGTKRWDALLAVTPHRAVTFDLWHTLVYLPPEEETTYMSRLTEAAVDVLDATPVARGHAPVGRRELRARFEEESARAVRAAHQGRSISPESQIAAAGRATGRRPRPGAYSAAIAGLLEATSFRVEPSAVRVLHALRERGYRVGLVSNTVGEPGRLLRRTLHRFGLDRDIEAFVFSDEGRWAKPAPGIFRKALRALGCAPQRAVHVGDSWPDIEGARRAGFRGSILFTGLQRYADEYRALFVRPEGGRPVPTATVSRLADVVPTVDRLLPPGR